MKHIRLDLDQERTVILYASLFLFKVCLPQEDRSEVFHYHASEEKIPLVAATVYRMSQYFICIHLNCQFEIPNDVRIRIPCTLITTYAFNSPRRYYILLGIDVMLS